MAADNKMKDSLSNKAIHKTTLYIERALQKEFHIACLKQDTSMSAVITELIKEWLNKNNS